MNVSNFAAGAAIAGLAAVAAVGAIRFVGSPGDEAIRARLAALEAGQKDQVRELQEIKALLRSAPPSGGTIAANIQVPEPPQKVDFDVSAAASRGRADAKLTLVEFSDFQCPFCGRYSRDTMPQIEKEYVDTGKVRYMFKNYPLERLHPLAKRAAEAAECARVQGKFWEMHTRLFASGAALGEADLPKHAQAVGLAMPTFTSCFAGQSAARVKQDQAEGLKTGITGTPSFFLGTVTKDGVFHSVARLSGAQPYAAFKKAIDSALNAPEAAAK